MPTARLILLLCACAAAAFGAARAAAAPERILSLNLCADQYLLALADPSQIAALTSFATDPHMSAAAGQAEAFASTGGSIEEVLAIRPDLVIATPFSRAERGRLMQKFGVETVSLQPANSFLEVEDRIREVGQLVGRSARAELLVADMRASLAALPRNPGQDRTAAYYQRRGYLTGGETLVDDLMQRAGLRNLATELGRPALSRLSLEEIALARPDFLIVEEATLDAPDRGAAMLRHPLLEDIPRLVLPQAWTVCGGPAYVRAAAALAEQLRRADADPPVR
ncbi:iron ABC transporter [Pacificimonas flava]|uniref:Iron ABC transporter n=2 Tax=Pacificimonas TaxID=1960290 RepID=A0A219B1U0_9SPHN|nr:MULTISPECIES: ABC transporter substrate-binding protein [Pacificimonas]MBZ6378302.1 ABC transporter substrate-binding protein [Pacificimonas aurantium]OWV32086.1 iron ABC transporter [Pacificimonas flava]